MTMSFLNAVKSFFVSLVFLVGSVGGQGTVRSEFPINESTTHTCSYMIERHTFQGSCCSVKDKEDGGCELTVIDGRCKVRGIRPDDEIWFLDFTSRYSLDSCPESKYSLTNAPTVPPTFSPTSTPAPTMNATANPDLSTAAMTNTKKMNSKGFVTVTIMTVFVATAIIMTVTGGIFA